MVLEIPFFDLTDFAAGGSIGLGLGRKTGILLMVNYGGGQQLPWGMVFPDANDGRGTISIVRVEGSCSYYHGYIQESQGHVPTPRGVFFSMERFDLWLNLCVNQMLTSASLLLVGQLWGSYYHSR